MIWRIETLAAILTLAAWPLAACETQDFEGIPITFCEADAAEDEIRLFLYDADGAPYSTFGQVNAALSGGGQSLRFAMNGGMYHEDRAPVGHYVEEGREIMRVISSAGPGNFGMLPNGVFCIREGRADVIETERFLERAPDCDYATQSGPMLVIEGALHPRFLPDSTSRYIRNGVGTSADGRRVVFAVADAPITFHAFARVFRDMLDLPNALFLDGNVSRFYIAETGRSDFGRAMGPILGVIDAVAE